LRTSGRSSAIVSTPSRAATWMCSWLMVRESYPARRWAAGAPAPLPGVPGAD
jgi:hypothetical protein